MARGSGHADAGVGIGMPALVLVKNEDYGYENHKKNEFLQFSYFVKSFKQESCFFRKLPVGGFARKHNDEC